MNDADRSLLICFEIPNDSFDLVAFDIIVCNLSTKEWVEKKFVKYYSISEFFYDNGPARLASKRLRILEFLASFTPNRLSEQFPTRRILSHNFLACRHFFYCIFNIIESVECVFNRFGDKPICIVGTDDPNFYFWEKAFNEYFKSVCMSGLEPQLPLKEKIALTHVRFQPHRYDVHGFQARLRDNLLKASNYLKLSFFPRRWLTDAFNPTIESADYLRDKYGKFHWIFTVFPTCENLRSDPKSFDTRSIEALKLSLINCFEVSYAFFDDKTVMDLAVMLENIAFQNISALLQYYAIIDSYGEPSAILAGHELPLVSMLGQLETRIRCPILYFLHGGTTGISMQSELLWFYTERTSLCKFVVYSDHQKLWFRKRLPSAMPNQVIVRPSAYYRRLKKLSCPKISSEKRSLLIVLSSLRVDSGSDDRRGWGAPLSQVDLVQQISKIANDCEIDDIIVKLRPGEAYAVKYLQAICVRGVSNIQFCTGEINQFYRKTDYICLTGLSSALTEAIVVGKRPFVILPTENYQLDPSFTSELFRSCVVLTDISLLESAMTDYLSNRELGGAISQKCLQSLTGFSNE